LNQIAHFGGENSFATHSCYKRTLNAQVEFSALTQSGPGNVKLSAKRLIGVVAQWVKRLHALVNRRASVQN
jgi:hypothetical protein